MAFALSITKRANIKQHPVPKTCEIDHTHQNITQKFQNDSPASTRHPLNRGINPPIQSHQLRDTQLLSTVRYGTFARSMGAHINRQCIKQ